MTDVRRLLAQIGEQEEGFRRTEFIAPRVRGGEVRARVAGLVQTFRCRPADFEGWGIFRPADAKTAELVEEAGLPLVDTYLGGLTALRFRLAHRLQGRTWLAYPGNESDARQRHGAAGARPAALHLVSEGGAFDAVLARWDGGSWWFEEADRRADPVAAERLREALREVMPPEAVRFPGMTPEMRTTYDLAAQQAREFAAIMARRRDTGRLEGALRFAGGSLREFQDRGDYWVVEWTTRDGERHTSAIGKRDLTVVSAGICLSGRDRDFDLQSLVGVMEGAWE